MPLNTIPVYCATVALASHLVIVSVYFRIIFLHILLVTGIPSFVCRQFNRSMLKFIRLFVGRYPYYLVREGMSSRNEGAGRCVHGDLARSILIKINRVDSIQSYNLPSLELTLLTLMQITAR